MTEQVSFFGIGIAATEIDTEEAEDPTILSMSL